MRNWIRRMCAMALAVMALLSMTAGVMSEAAPEAAEVMPEEPEVTSAEVEALPEEIWEFDLEQSGADAAEDELSLEGDGADVAASSDEAGIYSDFAFENGVLTGYTGEGGDVVIPPVDGDGNIVTAIGDAAFMGNTAIICVIIPQEVTEIGESAFEGCTSLGSVELPGTVARIGRGAFNGCELLTNINLY